jgi:glutathione reductase (NADPH)
MNNHKYDYDLFVIGAGSGGVRASRIAANLGAKVAVAEERYLGGTCVNVGCVPKKLLVYSASYRDSLITAEGFGWNIGESTFDWDALRNNKDQEIARLNAVYRDLLINSGVHLLEDKATIVDPHRVRVGDAEYTAERILIATGGWPQVPEFPGCEYVISSNEVFFLEELPKKVMIVGGGYIGAEFSAIFNGLGVETHLSHRGDLFLKDFDEDIRRFAAVEMEKKGIQLHFETDIVQIQKCESGELIVSAKNGRQWHVGLVIYATGRRPKSDSLGLENTGVTVNENGSIKIDKYFQTTEPSIYALGDVVGHKALTPVALAEGTTLAHNLFGGRQDVLDYRQIPTAVFCQPTIASVGLTEAQARSEYEEVDVYSATIKPMQFSLSSNDEKALIKLLVDKKTDKILGCHMVGLDAAEIMQGLAIALKAGATKKDFDRTIGIHPTLAEEFVTLRQPQ